MLETVVYEILPNPVGKTSLNVDLKKLTKLCYQEKKKGGRNFSNRGGWQSLNMKIDNQILKELCSQILTVANEFKKLYLLNKKLEISNLWININNYKDYNVTHTHPRSLFSGVFYVVCPLNSGSIVFERDAEIGCYIEQREQCSEFNKYNSTDWKFDNVAGQLLIFPSWLRHRVEANMSKKDRISISFNIIPYE